MKLRLCLVIVLAISQSYSATQDTVDSVPCPQCIMGENGLSLHQEGTIVDAPRCWQNVLDCIRFSKNCIRYLLIRDAQAAERSLVGVAGVSRERSEDVNNLLRGLDKPFVTTKTEKLLFFIKECHADSSILSLLVEGVVATFKADPGVGQIMVSLDISMVNFFKTLIQLLGEAGFLVTSLGELIEGAHGERVRTPYYFITQCSTLSRVKSSLGSGWDDCSTG